MGVFVLARRLVRGDAFSGHLADGCEADMLAVADADAERVAVVDSERVTVDDIERDRHPERFCVA
jgi:hypothetical protein